ncbi:MAG: UvrD-helicase domain-containing protein [Methanomicrobiaceae archaeon]|nr:UvrD-helicase domain-containing protein [Methanomicrobiaceae archaeon]
MALNPKQQEAVTSAGIQLVLAGPGSGKTRVITEKILHLVGNGAAPGEILALTFSEKAAREMEERLEKAIGTASAELSVQTFHSFCLQVLEDNVLDSGINFSTGLISRANQLVWGLRTIDAFGFEYIEVGNNAARVIESIIDGISRFRDELIGPAELEAYLAEKLPSAEDEELIYCRKLQDLLRVYVAYEQYKRREMLLDYDDMIHETVRLFERKPHILAQYRRRYPYVLVDEFQDTNYAQLALIKQLCGEHLCVVGDDDQTIYRFRGAYFGNFDDFRRTYAGHCQTLLDQNYRSTNTILRAALQLMEGVPGRQDKPLFTGNPEGEPIVVAECENEEAEALYVLREIERLLQTTFFDRTGGRERAFRHGDFAILCRRRADGVKFYQFLTSHGIPCEFTGEVAFFSMPAVRDMMAYLRAVGNPLSAGIALNRIMKVAGVPETVVQAINAKARAQTWGTDHTDGVYEAMCDPETVPEAFRPQVAELAGGLDALIGVRDRATLPELVYEIMMRASAIYRAALADDSSVHRQVLNEFYTLAKDYAALTREARVDDFLEYLALLADADVEIGDTEAGDAVQVLTLHKSKGKEFPVVFLADLAERKFPLRYQEKPFYVPRDLARGLCREEDEKALYLQEERRLCYVGMTRAEERLYFTRAKWYGENKRESKPSQFLEELTYRQNALIEVVEVPAEHREIRVQAKSELEVLRHSLQAAIIRAVAEMRLQTALQRLMDLEKVRRAEAGEDWSTFDREAFFAVPEDPQFAFPFCGGEKPSLVGPDHAFSASSLATYETCPLQYKFRHVLMVPSEPKSFFGFGSVVHRVIENLAADELQGVAPARERARALLEQFWSPAGYASRKQEREDRERAVRLLEIYLAWHFMNNNRVIGVEERFQFTCRGRTMKGSIDRIEQTPGGEYVVIDFKSGSKPSSLTREAVREHIQLNLYCLAIRERYGALPRRASLFYLGDNKLVDYRPDETSIAAFEETLAGMIGSVCAEEFGPTPSYQGCMYCDYGPLCEEKEKGG